MPTAATLLATEDLYLGELECDPDDWSFGEDAYVTSPIVALPISPTWVVRGHRRDLANANHAVIHQPGDVYRRERFERRGYRCLFVYPHPVTWREIASTLAAGPRREGPFRLPRGFVELDPVTFARSRRLARALRGGDADPLRASEHLYGVLEGVVRAATQGAVPRDHPSGGTARAHAELAGEASAALTARFHERLTLEDLGRSLHVSPFHLTRVFRRQTGSSLHGYLTQLRLRAAFDRIRDGHDDLATLAAEVGFSSHSHMTSAFHRAFGAAPSSVRSDRARF